MVAANGRHYLYFSVGPQNPTPSRIGVATCAGLEGTCTDSGKPLITGGKGLEAIDPAVFVDPASQTPFPFARGSAGAKLPVWDPKATRSEERRVRKSSVSPCSSRWVPNF